MKYHELACMITDIRVRSQCMVVEVVSDIGEGLSHGHKGSEVANTLMKKHHIDHFFFWLRCMNCVLH